MTDVGWRRPLGPLRDKFSVTIGTADYEPGGMFVCQVATAGALTYRTALGDEDQTESGLASGAIINAAGVPVLLRIVRGSSTVTSIVVGKL